MERRRNVAALGLFAILCDVTAAIAYLRDLGKTDRPTFVVGFCRGGTLALHTAAEEFELSGIIPFYAGLSRPIPGAKGSTFEQASKIHTPVLGLFGGADPGIPASDIEQLDQQLDSAGVKHEVVTYAGATHSFFDRRHAEFAEASTDAWMRVLKFMNVPVP